MLTLIKPLGRHGGSRAWRITAVLDGRRVQHTVIAPTARDASRRVAELLDIRHTPEAA